MSELPRFNAARRYTFGLFAIGFVFVIAGSFALRAALAEWSSPWFVSIQIPRAVGIIGAAILAASSGFLSAALVALARQRHLSAATDTGAPVRKRKAPSKLARPATAVIERIRAHIPRSLDLAAWPQTLATLVLAGFAAYGVIAIWRLPPQVELQPVALQMFAGGIVVVAFPFLLLERVFANVNPELLPEAPQIERLVRLPLFACIAFAATMVVRSLSFQWPAVIDRIVGGLVMAIAAELALRAAVMLFIPFAPLDERRAVADSMLAGAVLRLRWPAPGKMRLGVRRHLGIDLSRSWALAFVLRAALPVIAGIGFLAWLVTGVTTLPNNQRGIYERFGAPVRVFNPGLHVHWPWPLGVIRPVEYGVIHQLPIEFLLPGGENSSEAEENEGAMPEQKASAEGPAPEEADRLWDDAHPFEGSYLIANEANGRQGFQLVDVDMAVIYQIARTDAAAMDAAYAISTPVDHIQALSGQLLIKFLTRNQLLDLLGKSRETLTNQFRNDLQAQLDKFHSGIEVLAVSFEAIHPPPGAAYAYHDVQAAEIRANTKVFVSQGDASRTVNSAKQMADRDRGQAQAGAAEVVTTASADGALFDADRKGYAENATTFVLERWLNDLTKALSRTEFVIIDHRLTPAEVPVLDLRNQMNPRSDVGETSSLPTTITPSPSVGASRPTPQQLRKTGAPDDND